MKASRSSGKTLVSLFVLAGLGAAPALAYADTDSYVEVQFDAHTIGDVLHRSIATMSTFCPQMTEVDGRHMFVDHLEYGHDGELSRADSADDVSINDFTRVEGRAVLYTQPVDVHLKSPKCAADPGCSTTDAIGAELTYELFTSPSSQLCMRSYSSRGLPDGVRAPEVDVCLPFNAEYAMSVAGLSGESASGSAVSLDRDGGRLAVRVELGRSAGDYDHERIDAWQEFVDGSIEATGATGDWSVFTHKSLILGAIQNRLSDALAAQAGFHVDGPIETSWGGGDSGARIDARLNGVFSSAFCPSGIRVSNIALTGKVRQNDPDSPTGLMTYGSVSYNVSSEDAAACGLALGGPMGALVFSSLADSIKLDLGNLGPNCHADGDFGFICNEKTHPQLSSAGPLQAATSTLAGVVGSEAGLAMTGGVRTVGDAWPTSDGHASSFRYDESTEAYESTLQIRGTASLCDATFWADQEGDIDLFRISRSTGAFLDYQVELPRRNVDAYENSPFHVMATVMTSAGVHTYEIDPESSLR